MLFKLCRLLGVITLCAATSAFASAQPSDVFSASQKTAIEKITRAYLINHPDVLVEASKSLQAKAQKEQMSHVQQAILNNKKDLFNNPDTPTAGNPKATIHVVEFFDYQCGHCRSAAPIIKTLMAHNPAVQFIFKELPIFGGDSKYAAEAALASHAQGKYLALHNKLFSADGPLSKTQVMRFASDVGLDNSQLSTAMNAPAIEQQIKDNFRLAESLGIMGTPAFVIGNTQTNQFQFIPGAASESILQKAIQSVKTDAS